MSPKEFQQQEQNAAPLSTDPDATKEDEIPPLIALAMETFRRDLPELLKKRYHQWVAYNGDKQIGIARKPDKLFRKCQELGLGRREYVVCCILPEPDPDEDCTPMYEV